MLLLFFSLFSNYDLILCNQVGQGNFIKTKLSAQMSKSIREIDKLLRDFQQEIQKQKSVLRTADFEDNIKDVGLLDYSVTPMWWGETTGVDQRGENQTASTFLPIPVGHGKSNSSEEDTNLWEKLNPNLEHLPEHPLLTTLGSLTTLSPEHGFLTSVGNFPFLTSPGLPFSIPTPSPIPEHYKDFLGDDYTFTGSPSKWFGGASKWTLSSTTPESLSNLSSSPPLPLLVLREPFTSNPKTNTTFDFFTLWKQTGYTPSNPVTKPNGIPPTTHRPRQVGHTLSKAQAWVRNRQWAKTSRTGGTSGGRTNEGTTKEIKTTVADLLLREDGQLFVQDDAGFLYVSTPATVSDLYTTNATAAGAVLYNAYTVTTAKPGDHPNKPYHDMMKELDEGPMMVFLLHGSKLITQKKESEVREVLYATEFIVNTYHATGEIGWAGDKIVNVITKVSRFLAQTSTHDISSLRTYANLFNKMLTGRDENLSLEVNLIIDEAESMYELNEGEELFRELRKFEDYTPTNSSKIGWTLCSSIMQAYLAPYTRQKSTTRCQQLMSSVRSALSKRFGDRRVNEGLLLLGGKETTKHSRQRKRINNSLKRRISIKRHLINRTKHYDPNEDAYRRLFIQTAEYPMLRSMLPITRTQKRFRVITPRQLRSNAYLNIERPTKDSFYRRVGRPIQPPNGMLRFFPQATKESEIKRHMQPTEVTKNLEESVSQRTFGRIKAELIRRIVEDSSYSDEEALLKRNLAG